jgi:hypothetical protein
MELRDGNCGDIMKYLSIGEDKALFEINRLPKQR